MVVMGQAGTTEGSDGLAGLRPRLLSRVYYGWVMLPVATMGIIATSPGQTFSISTFNVSLRESLDLTHSQLTGAYMLGTFLASLPMPWVGALMDRYGLRRTMTMVVLLFGMVCIAGSMVQGLASLFLLFLLLRMLGQGALGLLSGNTLPFWFDRKLGRVEGVRHFGMAVAVGLIPGINLWLIGTVGWRTTWMLLGVAVWGVMLPALWLFRNRPADVGQVFEPSRGSALLSEEEIETELEAEAEEAEGVVSGAELARSWTLREAVRTRAFWIVMLATAFWSMTGTAFLFNMQPLFEMRGLDKDDDVKLLYAGFAVSLAVMQLVGGFLADRFPLRYILALAMAGMCAMMWMVWWLADPRLVLPIAILFGVAQGLLIAASGPLWPRYFGTAHLGKIKGTLTTVMVSASSVGPFTLGLCVDLTGSYDAVLLAYAIIPIPLMLLCLGATKPVKAAA